MNEFTSHKSLGMTELMETKDNPSRLNSAEDLNQKGKDDDEETLLEEQLGSESSPNM